jgi:hypothetical protein
MLPDVSIFGRHPVGGLAQQTLHLRAQGLPDGLKLGRDPAPFPLLGPGGAVLLLHPVPTAPQCRQAGGEPGQIFFFRCQVAPQRLAFAGKALPRFFLLRNQPPQVFGDIFNVHRFESQSHHQQKNDRAETARDHVKK